MGPAEWLSQQRFVYYRTLFVHRVRCSIVNTVKITLLLLFKFEPTVHSTMRGCLLLACIGCLLPYAVTAFRAGIMPKLGFRTGITPRKTSITIPKRDFSTFCHPSVASIKAQDDVQDLAEGNSLQMLLQCKLWLKKVSASATAVESDLRLHPLSTPQLRPDESAQSQDTDQTQQHQRFFDDSLVDRLSDSEVLRELAGLSEQFASVVRRVADARGNSSADVASVSIAFAQRLHSIVSGYRGTPTAEHPDVAGQCADDLTPGLTPGAKHTTTCVASSDSAGASEAREVVAPPESVTQQHPAIPPTLSSPGQEEEYRQVAMRPVKQAYEQSTSREYRHLADDYLSALKVAPAASSGGAHNGAWSAGASGNLWGGAVVPSTTHISESALYGGETHDEDEGEGLKEGREWWEETDSDACTLEEEEGGRAIAGQGDAVLGLDSATTHPTSHITTSAAAYSLRKDLDFGRESPKDRLGKRLVREGGRYVYR